MNDAVKSWIYVVTQAAILLLLIFFTDSAVRPATAIVVLGRIVEVLGVIVLVVSLYDLRKSLTALPLPKDGGVLQVRGLYKYVRHPMYLGVLLLSFGIAISGGSYQKYLLAVALLVLFIFKARYEETLLVQKYAGYKAYMKRTPRFFPRLW
jgi:protein-S-isoprenylcysteine O-methyltransferase Ste14